MGSKDCTCGFTNDKEHSIVNEEIVLFQNKLNSLEYNYKLTTKVTRVSFLITHVSVVWELQDQQLLGVL